MKKIILIVTLLLIVPISGVKICFELDNTLYEKRVEKMNENNEYNIRIESLVEHKTLKMDDWEIHYFISGKENSNSIVFLHPAFSDHRAFDRQIDYFSKKYCVIAIDMIGHGLSKANKSKDKIDRSSKHISEILKREGVDKAHLVGVSMGSLIAQYFAFEYPEKIKSLTALGGYNIHKVNKEVEDAQKSVNLNLIFRALFSMKSFRKKIASMTCKSERGQMLFYATASHYERKSFMVMQGLRNVIKNRRDHKPRYPILMLIGDSDIELSKRMAEEWHAEIENSELVVIKNAGHCANIDKPNEFNSIVDAFLVKNDE